MSVKIIFIASLGHSGSTLLDFLLTSNSQAIGLGEIVSIIDDEKKEKTLSRYCSCGVMASECPFWGRIISPMHQLSESKKRYELIVESAKEKFGSNLAIIDSSKTLLHLKNISQIKNIEIKPIWLIKDVRNFTISVLDVNRRKNRISILREIFPERIFFSWYRGNQRISRQIASMELVPLKLSYEHLCLNFGNVYKDINDFAGRQYLRENATPQHGIGLGLSHILSGNRMRGSTKKLEKIAYDYRWFYRQEWIRPYHLLYHIRKCNTQLLQVKKNDFLIHTGKDRFALEEKFLKYK